MKDKIMAAALKLSAKHGFRNVTRLQIAGAAGVATGSVSYHYDSMRKLQAAIVSESIVQNDVVVFTQALAERHPLALKAPDTLKALAQRHLGA